MSNPRKSYNKMPVKQKIEDEEQTYSDSAEPPSAEPPSKKRAREQRKPDIEEPIMSIEEARNATDTLGGIYQSVPGKHGGIKMMLKRWKAANAVQLMKCRICSALREFIGICPGYRHSQCKRNWSQKDCDSHRMSRTWSALQHRRMK